MRDRAPGSDRVLELRRAASARSAAPARSRSESLAAWKLTASPTCGKRSAEMPDAGHDADGRDGDVPRPEAEGAGVDQPLERVEHMPLVRERLPHPHEHDVRQAPGRRVGQARRLAPRPHRLRRDLAGGQVVLQTHLPGGAERAPHRAAGLGRDADGDPVADSPSARPRSRAAPPRRSRRLPCRAAVGGALVQDLDAERETRPSSRSRRAPGTSDIAS